MQRQRKTIPIPLTGEVDVTDFLPIVDHRLFQSLTYKSQLSSAPVFPAATHTRFEHSLGVAKLTRRRGDRWRNEGCITPEAAFDLMLFGLLHDIGHGVGSHVGEPLCVLNHKQRGLMLLAQLREVVEECGGNFDRIVGG